MQEAKLEAARAGMKLAAGATLNKGQPEDMDGMTRASRLGASQAGGFIAAVALGMGQRGELGEEGAGRLARLAHQARSALSKDEQRLEFMLWTRGGIQAGSDCQGTKQISAARAFSKAYAEMGQDSFVELMMEQPFYSSEGFPNAGDMATIIEQLQGALPSSDTGKTRAT